MIKRTTRVILLKEKKKMKILNDVLGLLKKKRNSLCRMILKERLKIKRGYEEYNKKNDGLWQLIRNIYIAYPEIRLKLDAAQQPESFMLEIDEMKFRDLTFPVFQLVQKSLYQKNYIFLNKEIIDQIQLSVKNFMDSAILLAQKIGKVHCLLHEIKRLNRRIHLLEKIKIPDLKNDIKTIEIALSEREREEFIKLKIIEGMKK